MKQFQTAQNRIEIVGLAGNHIQSIVAETFVDYYKKSAKNLSGLFFIEMGITKHNQ